MKNKSVSLTALAILVFLCGLYITASAQTNDNKGANWNNPTGASIGSIINDQLANRMRAKAQAKSASSDPTKTGGTDGESVTSKKTKAQIDAAVHFRSTGTSLRTQAFADFLSEGGTPDTKKQMTATINTLLTEYEKAAKAQGKPNDLALATTAALVSNSSIYHGTDDPDDASIMEIRDAMAELMVEDGTFTSMADRQKQELYENLVISTMLAKAGYEAAKEKGDKATMATYRELAGQTLTAVSGLPPEKIRFMPDAQTIEALRKAAAPPSETNTPAPPTGTQNVTPATLSDSDFLNFDPFPDRPYVQPQKPLIGRLRKSITMADLAGNWEKGGASIMEYVNSSSSTSTSVSFGRRDYTIRADGTYESKFEGRASNTTIRESDSGTIILSGNFVIKKSTKLPAMRYQIVAFMALPNGAAVLSLIYRGDNPPLTSKELVGTCDHSNGYVSCGSEEWVRIP